MGRADGKHPPHVSDATRSFSFHVSVERAAHAAGLRAQQQHAGTSNLTTTSQTPSQQELQLANLQARGVWNTWAVRWLLMLQVRGMQTAKVGRATSACG